MEFFKSRKVYDFMRMRKFWIFLSLALTIGSVILLYYPGPNYGTDFRGGTEIEVAFTKPVDGGQMELPVTPGWRASPSLSGKGGQAGQRSTCRPRGV